MKYFVIADTHFGHENIIKYCNRPFGGAEYMDKEIIKRWNETVSKEDIVWMLGDFAFGKDRCQNIAKMLNGTKYLVKGNHDSYSNQFYRDCGFKEVYDRPVIVDFCIMSHAPMQLSETTPYFNFYGHVHNDEKYQDTATSKCVSVERILYRPFCFK